MEQYIFMSLHSGNGSATAVMWDIFSMDRHQEHVNLMVPGVETNLPVKVSTDLKGIKTVDICIRMYSNTHTHGMRFHNEIQ